MSAARIDHLARAENAMQNGIKLRNAGVIDDATFQATLAQAAATLALVEQQRIANLITLASLGSDVFGDALPVLQDEAAAALVEFRSTHDDRINGPDETPYTRSEIREALGLS